MPHELGGDLFRKENLAIVRGMSRLVGLACGMATNANLEVDVVGTAHVKTWKDSTEAHRSVRPGELSSPEKSKLIGRVVFRRTSHSPVLFRIEA